MPRSEVSEQTFRIAPLSHDARRRLRAEERAFQVGVEDQVPRRLVEIQRGRHLLDPGVVHQDIEPAQCLGGLRNPGAAVFHARDIHRDRDGSPANPPDCLRRLRKPIDAAPGDRHVGTRRRQAFGDGPADAAARAGDYRPLALK